MGPFYSFRIFRRAYHATRHEIATSLMILIPLTLLSTLLMWAAESTGGGQYSFGDALIWVLAKYVSDPAEITAPPVTIPGQVIGTLVGVLGVAIFAVPAGLIGSGLLEAMGEEKKDQATAENSVKLHKRFRRMAQPSSWFLNESGKKVTLKCVPRFRTFPHIMMKTGMTEEELIAAVNNCPDMRLMNLAATRPETSMNNDDLVVVHFPLNTEYGCFVDRKSDVTIVAPAAVTELGTGSFAYSLAAMGGFNYVSRELTPNPDDPFGFYNMMKSRLDIVGDSEMKECLESQALHFIADLLKLKGASMSSGRRHWFIFVLGTTKSKDCQIHFWRLATNGDGTLPAHKVGDVEYGSTVMSVDEESMQRIYLSVKEKTEPDLISCLDNNNVLKSVMKSNIMCRVGGGIDCNAVTMRVSYDLLLQSNTHLLTAKEIADAIKKQIEPDRPVPEEARQSYLTYGDGFADAFGETKFFETNAEKLKKEILSKERQALEEYGSISL